MQTILCPTSWPSQASLSGLLRCKATTHKVWDSDINAKHQRNAKSNPSLFSVLSYRMTSGNLLLYPTFFPRLPRRLLLGKMDD